MMFNKNLEEIRPYSVLTLTSSNIGYSTRKCIGSDNSYNFENWHGCFP